MENEASIMRLVVERNSIPILEYALSNWIDVSSNFCPCKSYGRTVLHHAAKSSKNDSHLRFIEALLEHGADVNALDEKINTPLHSLIKSKTANPEIYQLFIEAGAKVNVRDVDGQTALYTAAMNNDLQMVERLLADGADVNARCSQKRTSLQCAVILSKNNSHLNVIKVLLNNGADVDLKDNDGNTALHLVTQNKASNEEIAKCLLKAGANANDKNNGDKTALFGAVEYNNVEMVKILVIHGADVNLKEGSMGQSPLHHAVSMNYYNSHYDIIKELLENQADPNARDCEGNTALNRMMSDYTDNLATLRLLLAHGADVNARNKWGRTALHLAVASHENKNLFKVTKKLLKFKPDVNARDNKNNTPMHYPMVRQIFSLLVDSGAEIGSKNNDGHTPLHKAVVSNKIQWLELLLARGADPNEKDTHDYTPLHLAALLSFDDRSLDVVENLVNYGADVRATDVNGNTPFHLLARNSGTNPKIMKLLLKKGVDVNEKNHKGLTALHYAAIANNPQTVDYLLSLGAKIYAVDSSNKTALHCAASFGVKNSHLEVVEMLLDKGACADAMDRNGDTALQHLLFQGTDVNLKSSNCFTPLHYAVHESKNDSHLDIVEMLLKNSADVNACDRNGNSPLHLLINNNNKVNRKIFILLLNGKTNVNIRNEEGATPLHLAAKQNDVFALENLLSYKANVGLMDSRDWTPLHHAVFSSKKDSHYKVVEILLNKKVQVNSLDKSGDTPLHLLMKSETANGKIAKLLLDNSANVDLKNHEGLTAFQLGTDTVCTL